MILAESVAMRNLPVTLGTNAHFTRAQSLSPRSGTGYRAVVVSKAVSGQPAIITRIHSRTHSARQLPTMLAWKKVLSTMLPCRDRLETTSRWTKHDETARDKHSLICRPSVVDRGPACRRLNSGFQNPCATDGVCLSGEAARITTSEEPA